MNTIKRTTTLGCVALLLMGMATSCWAKGAEIPRLIEKNGRYALLVDGQPFFVLGGQAHNSSAWPGMLPQLWATIEAMHANTLEIPIYWEQIEPQPGKFDFSLVDTIIKEARKHNVRVVLLWFATWKNGSNHYMPEWMKLDSEKYPNIVGRDSSPVDSPSPHATATLEADTKAFTMVMKHLKEADSQHTVIMVQVENEPGSWGSVRDYSKTAQKLFESQVPSQLLKPEVLKALNRPVNAKGTWQEVFGNDADEYFHAWSIATYINCVAAAGKAVNPLPMYVNVALRDPLSNPSASSYESGGATDNVIPIWKAAAPSIDLLAPDIYLPAEKAVKVLELYGRTNNALFVPESINNLDYLYEVIARGGVGFSPFGVDPGQPNIEPGATSRVSPFGQEYALFAPMDRELARWIFEGKVHLVKPTEQGREQTMDFGPWQAVISFGGERRGADAQAGVEAKGARPNGRALIAQLGENEFVLMGSQCHITFRTIGSNKGKAWQFLKVEEGSYRNGKFELLRIRNGDETDWGGPTIGAAPAVLRIKVTAR